LGTRVERRVFEAEADREWQGGSTTYPSCPLVAGETIDREIE
jgi:hypothetical protein